MIFFGPSFISVRVALQRRRPAGPSSKQIANKRAAPAGRGLLQKLT
ncbi:MAG: hypothetical protein ACKVS6_13095 [Planctomycetota bacterium]